jgi:hypothetical protein
MRNRAKGYRRLTEDEAKQYYSKEEDDLNMDYIGYTMLPDPEDPKWDLITYYTTRRKHSEFKGEGRYYIYILENETMPGIYKIGYTRKKPEERAIQLSKSTGVPLPFKVIYALRCHDGEGMEYEIHKSLSKYRLNKQREFFSCTLEEATQVIEKISKRYV